MTFNLSHVQINKKLFRKSFLHYYHHLVTCITYGCEREAALWCSNLTKFNNSSKIYYGHPATIISFLILGTEFLTFRVWYHLFSAIESTGSFLLSILGSVLVADPSLYHCLPLSGLPAWRCCRLKEIPFLYLQILRSPEGLWVKFSDYILIGIKLSITSKQHKLDISLSCTISQ